jgi:hypothetical protein
MVQCGRKDGTAENGAGLVAGGGGGRPHVTPLSVTRGGGWCSPQWPTPRPPRPQHRAPHQRQSQLQRALPQRVQQDDGKGVGQHGPGTHCLRQPQGKAPGQPLQQGHQEVLWAAPRQATRPPQSAQHMQHITSRAAARTVHGHGVRCGMGHTWGHREGGGLHTAPTCAQTPARTPKPTHTQVSAHARTHCQSTSHSSPTTRPSIRTCHGAAESWPEPGRPQ